MSEESRDRGMLTSGDIEFLRGETSKSEGAARTNRNRIRERIINAIADFGIAFEHLEPTDRIQTFLKVDQNMPYPTNHTKGNEDLSEIVWDIIEAEGAESLISLGGIRSMHAFSYLGLFESLMSTGFLEAEDVHFESIVENLVEESLQDAYGKYNTVVNANVDVTIDEYDVDLDAIEDRFTTKKPVTQEEAQWLVQTRRISFQEMVEYVHDESRHKNWEQDSTSSEE